MVTVEKGTVIKAETIKTGTTRDGREWARGEVTAEKGYDRIVVWASNPKDIVDTNTYEVAEILAVKKSNRKWEKDGETKWVDEYSVNAKLVRSTGGSIVEGFSKLDDDDIPF